MPESLLTIIKQWFGVLFFCVLKTTLIPYPNFKLEDIYLIDDPEWNVGLIWCWPENKTYVDPLLSVNKQTKKIQTAN